MAFALLRFLLVVISGFPGEAADSKQEKTTPEFKSSPFYDFGSVYSGSTVRFNYILQNVGTADLLIRDVKTSCGCTVIDRFEPLIIPGAKSKLEVVVETKGLEGKLDKKIFLTTNDPGQINVELGVRGTIKPVVSMIPKAGAVFGKIPALGVAERVIRLRSMVSVPLRLKIRPARVGSPFSMDLKEISKGKEYDLVVRFLAPPRKGSFRARLELETGFKQAPDLVVTAVAVVPERIEVVPELIVLPKELVDVTTRVIRVVNHGEVDVAITGVVCKDDRIRIKTGSGKASKRVILMFPRGYQTESAGTRIVLETTDPEFGRLVVPVRTIGSAPPVARFDESYGLPIRVEPPALLIDAGISNADTSGSVTLYCFVPKKELELSVLDKGGERFSVDIVELEAGAKFKLKVTVKAPIPLGSGQGVIRLGTNLKEMPVVTIPCSVFREAHVVVRPRRITIPTPLRKPFVMEVRVSSRRKDGFSVTSASASNPGLGVTVEKPKRGMGHIVRLTVPAGTKPAKRGGALTIKTNDAEFPVLKVPVQFQGKKRSWGRRPKPRPHGSSNDG